VSAAMVVELRARSRSNRPDLGPTLTDLGLWVSTISQLFGVRQQRHGKSLT
jgi:hypothetical protein